MNGNSEHDEPTAVAPGESQDAETGAPWCPGPVWGAYLVFVVCLCLMLPALAIASVIPTFAGIMAMEVVFLAPALLYVRLRRLPAAEALRWRPIAPATALRAVVLGVLARGMTVPVDLATRGIVEPVFGPAPSLEELMPTTPTELGLALLFGAGLAAVVEEIVFRGAIQGTLEGRGLSRAVVVTSLMFAMLHLMPWFLFSILAVGVLLGVVTVRTNSIITAAIVHAANNATEFTGAYIVGGELQPGPVWLIVGLAVLFIAAFVEFVRHTRGTRWHPSPLAGMSSAPPERSEC